MTPFLEALVNAKLYPISKVRRIFDTVKKRENECALLVQRSTRKAVGTRAPNVKITKGNYYYVAPAAIGSPPFKRSSRLYSRVGYKSPEQLQGTIETTVYTDAYGHEKSGRHPHLTPVWEAAGPIMQRILAGTTSAPRYVEIPAARERKAASIKLGTMTLDQARELVINRSTGIGQPPDKRGGVSANVIDPSPKPGQRKYVNLRTLPPEQRSAYARQAAYARWSRSHKHKG